ncbi:MAG TPA: hypothetical protein VHP37_00830 [Burkholderiales bacterium]|nr:hypothetical protein [Burkholderiales bacterium]
MCVVLAPAVALGATKHAPAHPAEPQPLNAFPPIEAKDEKKEAKKDEKKDDRKDDKAAAAKGATSAATPTATAAPAETPPGTTSSTTASTPATPPPTEKPAVPPPVAAAAVAPAATATAAPANAAPEAVSHLLRDMNVTDILVAIFTLFVAIFAWRVSRGAAAAGAPSQDLLDANRRAIEASERAAEAAKRSAEAAERSATVLQDTAARQLRPYVTVKEFLQGPVKDEKNFLHGWVFQVVWQNSGATPTRGFRYWAALRQFDHEIPKDFDFAPPVMADFAGGELGSHSTVTSGTLYVPQTDVVLVQGGSRKAVLYGKAEYQDVLGGEAKRETRFAVEVILVADPGGANGTPFSFSYYPRHNSIT